MANPWVSGAWAVGALASDSWATPSPNTGVVWAVNTWDGKWAEGSWLSSWAEPSEFIIDGQAANLLYNRVISTEYIDYIIDGQTVSLSVNRNLTAEFTSFNITGQDASLISDIYRLASVNTNNELTSSQTGVSLIGENLTGTVDVLLIYGSGKSLDLSAWVSGAWASDIWFDGLSGLDTENLTNVNIISPTYATADMINITDSLIPFTDNNHIYHRLLIDNGSSTSEVSVEVLPPSGNIVGTVQPESAITIAGTSIFGGMTINSNMQVLLPVNIGAGTAVWETVDGNVTGRVDLSEVLDSPIDLVIPIWDDALGWDVINVTVKDITDINLNISAESGSFSLTGQDSNKTINRVVGASTGAFSIIAADAELQRSYFVQPYDLYLSPSVSPSFINIGMGIDYVLGLSYDVVQVGSEFSIYGVGFGNDNALDIVFVDVLGALVEGIITQINNSFIRVLIPSQSGALSVPVTMYVGDYQRSSGVISLVDNAPIPTSDRNVSRSIDIVSFASSDLYTDITFETPTLTQSHVLDVDSILFSQYLDGIALSAGTTSLVVNDSLISSSLSIPVLAQKHILSPDLLNSELALGTTTLTQSHKLNVNSLNIGSTLSGPSLVQSHVLPVNSVLCGNILGNNALLQHNILSVDGLSVNSSIDNISIVFTVGLNVNNLRCTLTENNVVLVPHYNVTPANVSIGLSSTTSSAVPTFTIDVVDININQTIDVTSLAQRHLISPDTLRSNTSISPSSLLQDFGTLVVDNITFNTRLSTSRAKITTDPLTADDIKSYPALSGEILINQ